MKIKVYRQLEEADCGPTCLRIIAKFYGKDYSLEELRELCNITRVGSTIQDLVNASSKIGFDTIAAKASIDQLEELPLPAVLHWRQHHFVVLAEIDSSKKDAYHIIDPGFGRVKLNKERFFREWEPKKGKGVILLFNKNENFETLLPKVKNQNELKRSWDFLYGYIRKHKGSLNKVGLTLIMSSVMSWVFPVLMQKLIDDGVMVKNLEFVWIILIAQLLLFLGQGLISWIRSVILVRVSMKMSIEIISAFMNKLIKLPISFFDSKLHTDILQRIEDQAEIEDFISNRILQSIFSVVSLVVLSSLLLYYNVQVFFIFLVLSLISMIWVYIFMDKRIYLDYTRFGLQSQNQSNLYEMITGMPEIKINNAQQSKISGWKKVQVKLYELKISALNLNQQQILGAGMITQVKNIASTFVCAYWVIKGNMTLGVMMSVSYILGQLSRPIDDLIMFFLGAQSAKLSFDRMDEIMKREEENGEGKISIKKIRNDKIEVKNLWFKYIGSNSPYVLKDINIDIPIGKKTAIVGASGSGKTTFMKLLLLFYSANKGCILIDGIDTSNINGDNWREKCGVVMQDGYIYSGSILENIAMDDKPIDLERAIQAMKVACIYNFVDSLPLKYNSKIGMAGADLSGGQKQRLFIARAVYRDPELLFFDEATSSLDASNEKEIVDNLNLVMQGKTVVVIAHRLSTVQDADQIIVLDEGRVVESGPHMELINDRGYYYTLIKNQLELGVE